MVAYVLACTHLYQPIHCFNMSCRGRDCVVYCLTMSIARTDITRALSTAWPIMLGYVAIGIPCGIMESAIGLGALTCFIISCTFYSGAGQFMIPNLVLAGVPIFSTIVSVSFVNMRQALYSCAFAPRFVHEGKLLSFLFAATVTDESFGVNMERFRQDETWNAVSALFVNVFSMLSWATANAVGCALGNVLDLPLAITSFAMTSIFICLAVSQPRTRQTLAAMAAAAAGVVVCKLVGLSGPAILVGGIVGVVAGVLVGKGHKDTGADDAETNEEVGRA